MNTTQMVTTWITKNAVGQPHQYDAAPAAAMLDQIAAEEFGGIVTTIDPDLVEAVIESFRVRAA